MMTEIFFSSNAWHNFAKGKVISKCKNDKPWKKLIGKVTASPFKKTCGGGSERCRILALSGNHPWKLNTRIRPQYLKTDLCSQVQMGDHDLKKYDNISQN